MARKTGTISILQFDERLIALLRVRPGSKGVEVIAHERETGQWSAADGSLAKALKAFVQARQVARDRVFSVLPRHDMTSRILMLPSHDINEIGSMIRLSAEEFVPYPAEDVVIDQCILQKMPDGHARVLAIFAHRDVVDTHVRLLSDAGIDPEKIFVSSACIASACAAAMVENDQRYAVANLASGGLEVLVLSGRRLEFARGVATHQDWEKLGQDGNEALEELVMEVRASLSAARRESEDGLGPERIYVSADIGNIQPAVEALFQETGYDASPADFTKNLLGRTADQVVGAPLALIGGALSAQGRAPIAINLVPESLIEARRRVQLKRKAIAGAALAAAILVSFGIYYGVLVYQRQAYLGELRQRIAELEPVYQEVISKERALRLLEGRLDRTGTPLQVLALLSQLAPPDDLNLVEFTYDREKGIVIKGRTKEYSEWQALVQSLRNASSPEMPFLARATQGSSRQVPERDETVIEYEIVIPMVQDDEAAEETADADVVEPAL